MQRLTVLLICLSEILLAQESNYQSGARNAALAGATSTLSDAYSVLNNPGALGRIPENSAFIGYQNRYNLTELQSVYGGFVLTKPWASTGICYHRFGGDLYNQQRLSFTVGNHIQLVSLGAGVSVIQYQVEGLETIHRAVFEFGGQAQLIPQLVFAAHIFNIANRSQVPTVMKSGLSYRPTEKWMLNVELEKNLTTEEIIKIGMEYQFLKSFAFRTGFANHPFKSAFGFGLNLSKLQVDYGFSTSQIGPIHDVSLLYKLPKK